MKRLILVLAAVVVGVVAVTISRLRARQGRTPNSSIDVERLRRALFRAAPAISPKLADRIAVEWNREYPAGGEGGWEW